MGGWTFTSKDWLEGAGNTMGNGEFNLGINELLNVRTTDLGSFNFGDTDDLDGTETGTMTGSHVHVKTLDSFNTAHGTELLVHVVGAGTRIVTQPNTKVLNLHGLLFAYRGTTDDFAGRALGLLQLAEEVEETGFGDDFVGSEDAHLVELGSGFLLGWELTTNDLILEHFYEWDILWILYRI